MDESGHHVIEVVGATVGLLLVAAGVMAVSKRIKIPFTVALVVTGIALAQLAHFGGALLEPIANLRIAPEIAFFVLLPTLIFESAFNLEARALRQNLTAVSFLHRFGSGLNPHFHYHVCVVDGLFEKLESDTVQDPDTNPETHLRFHEASGLTRELLERLQHTVRKRVLRHFSRPPASRR